MQPSHANYNKHVLIR